MALWLVMPARSISSMIGSTLTANCLVWIISSTKSRPGNPVQIVVGGRLLTAALDAPCRLSQCGKRHLAHLRQLDERALPCPYSPRLALPFGLSPCQSFFPSRRGRLLTAALDAPCRLSQCGKRHLAHLRQLDERALPCPYSPRLALPFGLSALPKLPPPTVPVTSVRRPRFARKGVAPRRPERESICHRAPFARCAR